MSCENCTNCKPVDGIVEELTAPAMVPLSVVEGNGYRRERTLRGTVIVFCVALLVIAMLVGAFGWFAYQLHIQSLARVEAINQRWLDYLSKYDFSGESYEFSQDGRGINVIGSGNGVDYNVPLDGGVNDDGPTSESDGETANPEGR